MERDETDERLSAYLDGELPPAERAALEAELARSEPLRRRLDELKALSALIKTHARAEAPAWLGARALAQAKEPERRAFVWLKPGLAVAGAAAAVAVVLETRQPEFAFRELEEPPASMDELERDADLEPPPPAAPPPADSMGFDGSGLKDLAAGAALDAPQPSKPAEEAYAARQREVASLMRAEESRRADDAAKLRANEGSAGGGGGASRRKAALDAEDSLARVLAAPSPMQALRGARAAPPEFLPGALEKKEAAEPAPAAVPAAAPEGRAEEPEEWSGEAAFAPKRLEQVVLKDSGAWLKFWPLVSEEPLPLLDFQTRMVVGLVAPAGTVRIEALETGPEGIAVSYSLAPGPGPSYYIRSIPWSQAPISFRERKP